ncbi:putative S-adenosyl-L-methionine-dependent methyltransferase-domain-containing protein [Cladorrhinum samala]|uniref:Protein arginine methyltransferase NDUFAF7 n=1 Tax=Cladorrhinum samala TaxID=585594 RepID=A0AAV9I3S8_9PEZI|nr:putative S-adenosyl-L-methionine-dependent methyltransferase-domain-containing protein [Cladorrhinum samala]
MKTAVVRALHGARRIQLRDRFVSRAWAITSLSSSIHSSSSRLITTRPCFNPVLKRRGFSATSTTKTQVKENDKDDDDNDERKWSTPLAKQLAQAIDLTGPIPLASYMRMCLTADVGGYYTGALEEGRDQFGLKGDFVTSPEISQVFGELIGVWFLTEWLAQGRQKTGVELIEVGPGRGTLMDDMLRTIQNFPAMSNSIDAIYMVEASPELRAAQKKLLCGPDAPMTESKVGYHSVCKYNSIPIVWTETIKSIPQSPSKMPFIVAHEFFDALPIHAFQLVSVPPSGQKQQQQQGQEEEGQSQFPTQSRSSPSTQTTSPTLQWREMLVSPTPPGSTHSSLNTPASQSPHLTPPPDFQLTLSKSSTRHSLYLPDSSPRFRALKRKVGAGALLEVCPDLSLYASDFASRIGGSARNPKQKPSGAALILDYGPGDGSIPTNSLRGIRKHKRVSPFTEPGLVDLSVDVDFAAVAEAATLASEGVEVHGPVAQGVFLEVMGIKERADALAKKAKKGGKDEGEAVDKACKRLVDMGPGGMGKIYQALAILPENEGRRRPVGFGGDVVN